MVPCARGGSTGGNRLKKGSPTHQEGAPIGTALRPFGAGPVTRRPPPPASRPPKRRRPSQGMAWALGSCIGLARFERSAVGRTGVSFTGVEAAPG